MLEILANRFFFRPGHHYLPSHKQELLIPAPWGHIQVWREFHAVRNPERSVLVLRFLGSRGRAEMATLDPADRLPDMDAEVWTVNPPGYGASSGPATLTRYADAALCVGEVLDEHAAGRTICVAGKSLGTTAALLVAAEHQTGLLLLRNVTPIHQLVERRTSGLFPGSMRGRIQRVLERRLDCVLNAKRCMSKALFVVSEGDRVSPHGFQQEVAEALAGKATTLVVKGSHDSRELNPADEVKYVRAVKELFS